MKAIETFAVFDEDGKMIIENPPLLKNKKVKLLMLIEEDEESGFYNLSSQGLSNAYAVNEFDYDLTSVKEPNVDYESR